MCAELNEERRVVAIYHASDHERAGEDSRLGRLRRFAATKGWRIAGEYVDYRGDDYFEFEHLIGDAHKRRFEVLLFDSLDTWCRGGCRDAVSDLSVLLRLGIDVRSLEEPALDTTGDHADVVKELITLLARQEVRHRSRRISRGMSQARRRGKKIGRPRVSAEVQREIARRRRAGKSLAEIARDLQLAPSTVLKYSKPSIDVLLRRDR